ALAAVVGTGVASARGGPSADLGPVTCALGAGAQTTAVWNKAKVTSITFEWFTSGADPFKDQPLDSHTVSVTTHQPKGSQSVDTSAVAQTGTDVYAVFQTADLSLTIQGDPCS